MSDKKRRPQLVREFRKLTEDQRQVVLTRTPAKYQQYLNDTEVPRSQCRGLVGKRQCCIFAQSSIEGFAQCSGQSVRCLLCDDAKLHSACTSEKGRRSVAMAMQKMNPMVQDVALGHRLPRAFVEQIYEHGLEFFCGPTLRSEQRILCQGFTNGLHCCFGANGSKNRTESGGIVVAIYI